VTSRSMKGSSDAGDDEGLTRLPQPTQNPRRDRRPLIHQDVGPAGGDQLAGIAEELVLIKDKARV
jgi:hypothetical protein